MKTSIPAAASDDGFLQRCAQSRAIDWRNLRLLLGAYFLWAVCFVGASQALKREWIAPGAGLWLLAAVPTIAGVLVFFAYVRFLRESDELQRLIHLNALSLGFGGTFLAASGYKVFMRLGSPALDLGDLTLVMAVIYTAALLIGTWRYR